MADQVLTRDGPISVPMDYVVPLTGELMPLMVRATIDGTSAAAAFYAVVQIIAPSGRVMGNAVTPSIAAGASADVTWFPRVATGSGTVTQKLVGARIQASSFQTVTNATNSDLVYQDVFFDTDGMANIGADARILTVHTPGIYLVIAETLWVYDGVGEGRRLNTVIQNGYYSAGGIPDQFSSIDDRPANFAPVGGDGFGAPRTTNSSTGIFQAASGDFFSSGCYQASGGNLSCNGHANCFLSALLVGS